MGAIDGQWLFDPGQAAGDFPRHQGAQLTRLDLRVIAVPGHRLGDDLGLERPHIAADQAFFQLRHRGGVQLLAREKTAEAGGGFAEAGFQAGEKSVIRFRWRGGAELPHAATPVRMPDAMAISRVRTILPGWPSSRTGA